MDDVSYVPQSGLDDAQEYADQIDSFIEKSKVLTDETNIGVTSGGNIGSVLMQSAIGRATDRFEARSAALDATGKNVALLMSSEMVRMVASDQARADALEGPPSQVYY